MKIEPMIMNKEFEKIAVIDDYISLIWTSRYYTCGDFEMCVDVNEKNKNIFKPHYYVMRNEDDEIGIIEKVEVQVNEDEREIVIISGRFLSSILSRRIIAKQTQLNGTVSSGIYNLIYDAVINPEIVSRKIPNFYVNHNSFQNKLVAQYTGKNLLSTIEEICETYQLGFRTTLTEDKNILFELYKGVDRSYDQTINPYVIFSDDFDNLLSTSYFENYQDVVTDVLVAGEGEGLDRKTLWVSNNKSLSGLERFEGYKDQRNISTNDGEISDEEYNNHLREEGLENICDLTKSFNGTVYFDNIKYKEDIYLGDMCVIENKRWGIYINIRLVEVIESVNENGEYSIIPTFGI